MPKHNTYPLAMEIDRALNLNLNNGRFQTLVSYIDSHEDSQQVARQLMRETPQTVMSIIDSNKSLK